MGCIVFVYVLEKFVQSKEVAIWHFFFFLKSAKNLILTKKWQILSKTDQWTKNCWKPFSSVELFLKKSLCSSYLWVNLTTFGDTSCFDLLFQAQEVNSSGRICLKTSKSIKVNWPANSSCLKSKGLLANSSLVIVHFLWEVPLFDLVLLVGEHSCNRRIESVTASCQIVNRQKISKNAQILFPF